MSITIYGSSDDLIEVEGDVTEEFTALRDEEGDGGLIVTNTGAVVRVRYDRDGIWRIQPTAGYQGQVMVTVCLADDDDRNYSDRCVVHGDIQWVVFGSLIARARR